MPRKRDAARVASTGGGNGDRHAGAALSTRNCTTIFACGKVIGQVFGDGTFVKRVHSSRHMLQKPPAWALDVGSLQQAKKAGATAVELHDGDTGVIYSASISLIERRGFAVDRGHGAQVALPLALWQVSTTAARQLSLAGVL